MFGSKLMAIPSTSLALSYINWGMLVFVHHLLAAEAAIGSGHLQSYSSTLVTMETVGDLHFTKKL